MHNNINGLDPNDDGLKAIMGDRFHDETTGSPTAERKRTTTTTGTVFHEKTEQKPNVKPTKENKMVNEWEPEKSEPNWMDNLKDSAKWTALFAALSFLIFYWAQKGLMATSIAIPCNWVCLVLSGFFVGKCMKRGIR